jgi:hypothetical protein
VYGELVFFDGKALTNKEKWPLFLPSINDQNSKIQRVGVAVANCENGQAAELILGWMHEMTPGWIQPGRLVTLMADDKLGEEQLKGALPAGALYVQMCTWHWTTQGVPNNLGRLAGYEEMKSAIYGLIEAKTVAEFEMLWQEFQSKYPSGANYMSKFVAKRHLWCHAWCNTHFNNGTTGVC